MSWWDMFSWGYATDIEELDEDQEINIQITIDIED